MESIKTYVQGIDRPHILIAQVIFIGFISNYITYTLANHYNLSWIQMIFVVALLMVLSTYLVNYLTPLRYIQDILDDMKKVHVFGIAIFGASNIFASMVVLYKHYGLLYALAISFCASTLAGIIIGTVDQVVKKANIDQPTLKIT
jgi:hypothetical protein